MKPEIKIEPARGIASRCYGCSGNATAMVVIGHTDFSGRNGNTSAQSLCDECQALLLLALLAKLPAVPCGYTMNAEIFGKPPHNVDRFVTSELGTMHAEEAAGIGAELIRKALEAAKL